MRGGNLAKKELVYKNDYQNVSRETWDDLFLKVHYL